MNTPPTKKRDLRRRATGAFPVGGSGGTLTSGIQEPQMQAAYATSVSYWPFVEDGMSRVLSSLLGVQYLEIASEIFHALLAQNTRLPVMRALLQNTAFNADRPEEFDAILDDFKALNDERNLYVHGYWFTEDATGDCYLCKSNRDPSSALMTGRRVKTAELEKFQSDCHQLLLRSIDISAAAIRADRERRG